MEGHFVIISTLPVLQGRGSRTALGGGDKGLGAGYQEMAAFAGVKHELDPQDSLFKT